MFGDQTPSNIVWWPNMLMLKWVSKRLKHVQSNTDQTTDTSRWASVVRMSASNMFDTPLSKRTKHRQSNTRTKEVFWVCDRVVDGLQILSNTTKNDQTRSNSTKQGVQTVKCLFTKHWPPNISRLSRSKVFWNCEGKTSLLYVFVSCR